MNMYDNYLFTRGGVLFLIVIQTTATYFSVMEPCGLPHYHNVTANGNSKGAPCVFPFFYNGMFYNKCTCLGRRKPWCSTTDNYTRDGQWGECLDYDVCQSHKTLSEPWRNLGFNLTSFNAWTVTDLYLEEGWYRFTGIGGDRLVYYCLDIILSDASDVLLVNDSGSSGDLSMYTCDAVVDSVQSLDCGGGLVLYYLFPIDETYTTRHSSCDTSPCGKNTTCDAGSCVCDSDLLAPVDFLTSYLCTDSIPPLTEDCKVYCSAECGQDLLSEILSSPAQLTSKNVVTKYLNEEMKCVKAFEDSTADKDELVSYGDSILKATEKLVAGLVRKTDTYYSVNITLETLEVQLFVVGPNASLSKIPRLDTSNAYLDIDLIGIAMNNNGSAAVAIISYNNLSNILKPSNYITNDGTVKTMMSSIVSVVLFNVTIKQFTRRANLTLKHITEVDPDGSLAYVTWKDTKWLNVRSDIIWINSTQTVSSIDSPGTFAVIMQVMCTSKITSKYLYLLNMVAVSIGLGFLGLTLLTFALCRQHLKINSTAQVNICISLLLAHLLLLLTQHFLHHMRAIETMCAAVAGVLHFLFLSAFVWMFLDALLLFISAKNLTKIRNQQEEVLGWKCLTLIGYSISMVIVGVSAGLVPEGYGSEQCWLKMNKGFFWSFLGPVCVILALNLIIFSAILILVIFTLKKLNNKILQRKNTLADKKVIQSVMLKTMAQFFILGCPWILGFFTCRNEILEVIFLFLNSQQGTFIFLIHCVLNREVREQCRKVFCMRKKPIASETSK